MRRSRTKLFASRINFKFRAHQIKTFFFSVVIKFKFICRGTWHGMAWQTSFALPKLSGLRSRSIDTNTEKKNNLKNSKVETKKKLWSPVHHVILLVFYWLCVCESMHSLRISNARKGSCRRDENFIFEILTNSRFPISARLVAAKRRRICR